MVSMLFLFVLCLPCWKWVCMVLLAMWGEKMGAAACLFGRRRGFWYEDCMLKISLSWMCVNERAGLLTSLSVRILR